MTGTKTVSAALAVLVAIPACGSGGATGDSANTPAAASNITASPSARSGASPVTPAAGEAEVRIFLADIYAPYASDDVGDVDLQNVLEPQLAAAVLNTEGGPGADPFIDAQDWVPFQPVYENVRTDGDRATATVRFDNGGAPTRIDYDLVRTPAGWRANDIRSANGGSLRERFLGTGR